MNATLLVVISVGSLGSQQPAWQPSPGHTQMAIWPGVPPDAQPPASAETMETGTGLVGGKPVVGIHDVSRPTLTVYSPTGTNTGAAVVVFPGGGYQGLAIDLEGTEVCEWLTAEGITCVLLKYRVPKSGPFWDRGCHCHVIPPAPTALEDAALRRNECRINRGQERGSNC